MGKRRLNAGTQVLVDAVEHIGSTCGKDVGAAQLQDVTKSTSAPKQVAVR